VIEAGEAPGAFVYTANPGRVIFGSGTLDRLPDEVERLGLERVLVLATPPQETDARGIADRLGGCAAGVFADAVMHTPVNVTEAALELVAEDRIDGIISIGGGSTIGLGKAIAVRTDLPQIVIPTTYAGSEMTSILGETKDGAKTTRSSPSILPEVVLYDVDLTLSLPAGMSGTSGLNAIAHAVEALYAKDRNPIISLMATEAIRSLSAALPAIVANPSDRDARAKALYGAWLCGTCLGAVGMSLHHKLCHTLGGGFDLPHAETHSIVLPHALAYNLPAVPEVDASLRGALGTDDPARALQNLARSVGAPLALRDLGMPETGIDQATDQALANPYWNPRALDRDGIRTLIARAWAGEPATTEARHG
jgi:maleylacetate reductase